MNYGKAASPSTAHDVAPIQVRLTLLNFEGWLRQYPDSSPIDTVASLTQLPEPVHQQRRPWFRELDVGCLVVSNYWSCSLTPVSTL